MADAKDIVLKVLQKNADQRTTEELDGAAEACYLIYANTSTNADRKYLSDTLAKLWKESPLKRDGAMRLATLSAQFGCADIEELSSWAEHNCQVDSLISFYVCARLLDIGQISQAKKIMLAVGSSAKYSMHQEVGLRSLAHLISHEYSIAPLEADKRVWLLYEGTEWSDANFVEALISRVGFTHVVITREDRQSVLMNRIAAAKSLSSESSTLRSCLIGQNCLGNLQKEIERNDPTFTEVEVQKLRTALGDVKAQSSEINTLIQNWSNLRKNGLDAIVQQLIDNGQVSCVNDHYKKQ